jgi:molybdopterin-containing oxidoreductase family membrane subunit
LILLLTAVGHYTKQEIKPSVFQYFKQVLRFTMPVNLFLLGCELFKEFYTGAHHSASAYYLYFGLHGHGTLRGFIWTAIIFNVVATTIFLTPKLRDDRRILYLGCGLTLVGIWVEKGMGLLFPGFIPNPLGEIIEYSPNATEIIVCLAIVAIGALLFTLMAKVTIAIQTGELRAKPLGSQ